MAAFSCWRLTGPRLRAPELVSMTTAPTPPLADAHVHLQEEVYEGHLEDIMDRARAAGIAKMLSNATHPGDWELTLGIARGHDEVVPCLGVHPWFIDHGIEDWLEGLRSLLEESGALVGEVGLDRINTDASLAEQREVLSRQIELAQRLGRPVMIHCVRAFGDLVQVLEDHGPWDVPFLMHAYGGSVEIAERLLDMGAYFSYGGYVLDERHKKARRALRATPPDRLLIETDAPAMLPPEGFRTHVLEGDRGRTWNEPANLPAILGGIADLLGQDSGELRRRGWENLERFLGGAP